MLNFYNFIQVFVFTINHHLNGSSGAHSDCIYRPTFSKTHTYTIWPTLGEQRESRKVDQGVPHLFGYKTGFSSL